MSHFAQIDQTNTVVQVIVAEQEFIDTGVLGDPSKWIQTSYNTIAGQHTQGGTPLRKNYAGIGYTYDADRDAFIPPKLYPNWNLNEDTCQWEPPTPMPEDGKMYNWDVDSASWVEVVVPE